MCLPNIKGDEIVGSVTQLLCGTERPQILHLKKVKFHYLADVVINSVRFSLRTE
jgi:hypothetical protein